MERKNIKIIMLTIAFLLFPCLSMMCMAQNEDEVDFQKALVEAQAGDTEAIQTVGLCYLGILKGPGVTQSDAKAVEWFSKGAEMGVPEAQVMLGACYQNAHSSF